MWARAKPLWEQSVPGRPLDDRMTALSIGRSGQCGESGQRQMLPRPILLAADWQGPDHRSRSPVWRGPTGFVSALSEDIYVESPG